VSERVVVTGLGVVSPFGTSVERFAAMLLAGSTGVGPVRTFDVSQCAARCAAAVDRFDPTNWIAPLKLRRLDVTSQYAVAVSREALDASGLAYGLEPDDAVGVVLGSYTSGGAPTEEYLEKLFTLGPVNVPTLIFNATVGNIAASATALELKLRGPNVTVSQKEASGLLAIGHAVDLLQTGQARALVAGGVDALFPLFYRVHDSFRVLSHANGAPEGSRPFDATRNGFVLGEGGFGVVLELESVARARNTPIYAEILSVERGGATTGLNQWPPSAVPLARLMTRALAGACVDADAIDVVYASANSTDVLDRVEAQALADVFGGRRAVITSIKGAIGESSAAGAAAVVAAIACARAGSAPPIAGLRTPDSACAGLRLAMKAEGAGPLALVNSVASGGAIASIVLRAVA
jgi:3-oxoacyl-[acyl-carrier-protein] synthase II